MKFAPQVQGRPQQATYATVKEHLAQNIQKTFRYGHLIAKSLEDGKKVDISGDKPTRQISELAKAAQVAEQKGFDIEYQERLSRYLDKEDALEQGMLRAYALIMSNYCTKTMIQRIEEHPDFSSKIKDNPIELLSAIQQLTHDTVRAQYPFVSVTDAFKRLLNMKQSEHEDLGDYVKRFKQLRDVLKSYVGTSLLDEFVKMMPEYRALPTVVESLSSGSDERKQMREAAYDKWMAYLLLANSDQAKYGSLLRSLVSQYSMGQDQYPTTLNGAVDILSNHKLDNRHRPPRRHDSTRSRRERDQSGDDDRSTGTSLAQKKEMTCYCCGKKGHGSNDCTKADSTPRDKWWIHKAINHYQDDNATSTQASDDQSVRSNDSRNRRSDTTNRNNDDESWEYQGFIVQDNTIADCGIVHKQTKANGRTNYNEVFILDSGSTIPATVMNQDLVKNIKPAYSPLHMKTNAGSKVINLKGDIPNFGSAWFDPEQIANIFGLSKMTDKYRVTFDSAKEDAFLVHTDKAIIKFARTPEGLYAYKPHPNYFRSIAASKGMAPTAAPPKATSDVVPYQAVSNLVSTVEENKKAFTAREREDAKRARTLYTVLGRPSTANFKHILRQNLIKNCPVTIKHVDIAEKIYGPDIGTLKGKSTRPRPKPVTDDLVDVPPEILENHESLTMCIDLMFVNSIAFLTGVDRSVINRSCRYLTNQTADELYKAIDKSLRVYNEAGFTVTDIHCDGQFRPLMDPVADDLNIKMNYATANEHVPEAERNNRVIKERIRAEYNALPYSKIPKLMIIKLAETVTDKLNWVPAKGGLSPYYSPHVILTKRPIDYNKHCQYSFGAYVQASNENDPTNTNAPRTIDAIYLCPTQGKQEGHELMDLRTGKLITRRRVTVLPVTPVVVKAVEAMATKQGITSLKFADRKKRSTDDGVAFYPADWIAGVDYEEPENENEDEGDAEYNAPNKDNYDYEDELDDDYYYDRVDQDEIDDLLNEPGDNTTEQEANPNDRDDEPEETVSVSDDDETTVEPTRRSARTITEPERLTYTATQVKKKKSVQFQDLQLAQLEQCHNLCHDEEPGNVIEYTQLTAMVAATIICDTNQRATIEGASFGQQYMLKKGLKKFGEAGSKAASKELDQLIKRGCFAPEDVSNLTESEKRKAQDGLMLLTEKRDGSVKGRLVYNGKPTRKWHSKEDAASPTASLESHFLCATLDAKEGRDVMTADIPNAFIQAELPPPKKGEDGVVMKITGVLVDLLVDMSPEIYGPYVVFEKGHKVLYVRVLRALYGMLSAALRWYQKFRQDLEGIGFVFNPYDPCVANRMIRGKQHTVRYHVDDSWSSHVDPRVNDHFLKWLNKMYGQYGEVKCTRGKIHDYLGMTFDFTEPGKVKIGMIDYVADMIDECSYKIGSSTAPSPAPEDLFAEGSSEALPADKAEEFHTIVAKGLYACKRARPDIHPTIAVLCTRVRKPNGDDWNKLIRLLSYLNGTRKDVLILSADHPLVIKWFVDAAFAVHPDFRSHTGGIMTLGGGAVQSISRKQKLNTRSSTESELVGADDASQLILWTQLFLEAQGYDIDRNILYQDNKSTILLETNGKKSSSNRTRALNIRYFFLTDQVAKGNLSIQYCPTTEMVGDYMSKPVQGKLFKKFSDMIMGRSSVPDV